MFLRRIGKFEKASRQTLEQLFNSKPLRPAENIDGQVDALEDLKDSDSLIENVMFPIDEGSSSHTSNEEGSKPNPAEAPRPRPSILIRSNSDAVPQRNLSRSVSFSMDVGREGLAHSDGRRGLIDSISRISNQNLVALDDNLTESTATVPSLSPLSAGDSASSFGLELEELEDDGDDTFMVPQKSEPVKPRVLTEVRTITSSSISQKRVEYSDSGTTSHKPIAREDQPSWAPTEGISTDISPPSAIFSEDPTSTDVLSVTCTSSQPETIPKAPEPEIETAVAVDLPAVSYMGISISHLRSLSEDTQKNRNHNSEPTQPERIAKSSSADQGSQQLQRNASSLVSRISGDDDDPSRGLVLPQRVESFDSISPGKEVNKRTVPSELRKLNSSVSRLDRPPLHPHSRSNASLLASVAMDKSIVVHPRERTDFAYETNTMMEGWMEKKSERTGLWLRVNEI